MMLGFFCPKYAMKLPAHTFLLMMLTAELSAQTITVINPPAKQTFTSEPDRESKIVICGAGGGGTDPAIRVSFAITSPPVLKADGEMDFEILVTSQTSKAFLVPQARNAFEVEDASNLLEPHQDAEINFLPERPGAQSVF